MCEMGDAGALPQTPSGRKLLPEPLGLRMLLLG